MRNREGRLSTKELGDAAVLGLKNLAEDPTSKALVKDGKRTFSFKQINATSPCAGFNRGQLSSGLTEGFKRNNVGRSMNKAFSGYDYYYIP